MSQQGYVWSREAVRDAYRCVCICVSVLLVDRVIRCSRVEMSAPPGQWRQDEEGGRGGGGGGVAFWWIISRCASRTEL